ncbi:MAG: hypothetical protein JXB88_09465 [Spirochaetales bacterium]|nr:hypothetical protein [Spirochaetales bacterium]
MIVVYWGFACFSGKKCTQRGEPAIRAGLTMGARRNPADKLISGVF